MSDATIVGYVVKVPERDALFADYVVIEVETRRLYLWPERLVKAGPTDEQRQSGRISKSQLRDLSPSKAWYCYSVGQRVQCILVDDRRSIVSCVEKHGNVPRAERKYYSHPRDGVMVYDTVCVFSDGNPRQCYSLDIKEVEVDQDYISGAMPNVPFNSYVEFVLDYEAMTATYRLHGIVDDNPNRATVALDSRDYLDCVPWLPNRRTIGPYPSDDPDGWNIAEDEVEEFMDVMQSDHEPKEKLKGSGFFLDDGIVYCKKASKSRLQVAWTAPEYRDVRWAGRVVEFDAYDCRLNRCYVIYRWSETALPIDCRISTEGDKQFKAGLVPSGFAGIYKNLHIGFVLDSKGILDRLSVTEENVAWVYVQYWKPDVLHCFIVSNVAAECYAAGALSETPEDTLIDCEALVVGPNGELFANELYNYRCVLPSAMRSQFTPGNWAMITANRNTATREAIVVSADALQKQRVPASYNSDRTQIRLKLAVRTLPEHPQYFWSPLVGPIRSPNKGLPSLTRFRGVEPFVVVRDDFGKPTNDEVRFTCVMADRDSF